MSQPQSTNFYREQAQRLTYLAVETANSETRVELLEIAASFHKLADHAAANGNATPSDKISQPA